MENERLKTHYLRAPERAIGQRVAENERQRVGQADGWNALLVLLKTLLALLLTPLELVLRRSLRAFSPFVERLGIADSGLLLA